jgi:hypothetical protein
MDVIIGPRSNSLSAPLLLFARIKLGWLGGWFWRVLTVSRSSDTEIRHISDTNRFTHPCATLRNDKLEWGKETICALAQAGSSAQTRSLLSGGTGRSKATLCMTMARCLITPKLSMNKAHDNEAQSGRHY